MSGLNMLPDGTPSPKYEITAVGDHCGTEKTVVLTEWWSEGKRVEPIEKSADDYFYEEAGFDKNPFTIISIDKL